MTYQRVVSTTLKRNLICDGFRTYMFSVLILPDVATGSAPGGTTDTPEVNHLGPLH